MKTAVTGHFALKQIVAGIVLATQAFAVSAAEPKPVSGGTLNVALGSDTPIIDPSITGYSVTALVTRNVVDSLVGQAEDNRFTPWLAEKWQINDDHTEYTFHLRRDVTFSDKTRLDAAAVKYNLERILDPKTTSSYGKSLLGPISEIVTPDDFTVVIRYKTPFASLLQGLSLPYLGIQSPTYLQNTANTSNTVVGSGPFILKSFVKGSGSQLTRRADYNWGPGYAQHQGPAYLEAINFKYLPESSVRLGALTSGQVQAIDAVPPASARSLKSNAQLQILTKENPGVNRVLYLNTSKGPFQDLAVRQAFQAALDPASAVKVAFFGTLKAADNVLGPQTLYYDPSVAARWGFDAAKAARLLDEAGWKTKNAAGIRSKDGQPLTVHFVYDPKSAESADITLFQALQFQAKKAGFDLQLDPVDAGVFSARGASNDYDIQSNFYVRAEPDILRTVFHSGYIPPKGANYSRVNTLDDQLTRAIGAADGERKQLYGQIQQRIIDQAYVVPVYVPAYQFGVSKKVHGVGWSTNAKPTFYDAWIGK
ncbi:ABC transporter substrate-binding protein [Erwinia sp. E602]|uniref:ABC transporter substrate-binding protein n=1 Tax=Erwinia sp. E602 TaxID=2675378 RepID=UPI001BA832CC|nr:ABC transporter substrate-binding protein [Erwinia sp. E602]QUG76119.1 ABC transporter substrate-binding protein [Erwinia sp. E602]